MLLFISIYYAFSIENVLYLWFSYTSKFFCRGEILSTKALFQKLYGYLYWEDLLYKFITILGFFFSWSLVDSNQSL